MKSSVSFYGMDPSRPVSLIVLVAFACTLLCASCVGCTPASTSQSGTASSAGPSSNATHRESYTDGWGLASDDLIGELVEMYDGLESYAISEIEDRKTTSPKHVGIGEEVEVTDNLAVSVVSVEPGPYDYDDNTPTVKVAVTMRNLTNKAIHVKASNWDADNSNSQRVDHKIWIKDERGERDVRSFAPTKVSPKGTFTGVVYFDGESLESIIYEPHWLISSQSQYFYFDL